MVYQNVSSSAIVLKLYRDLNITNSGWGADAIEWIGEALAWIGHHAGFENQSNDVEIESHRGLLPCDLVTILQVEFEGLPLIYSSDTTIGALKDFTRSTDMEPYGADIISTKSGIFETNPVDPNTFVNNFTAYNTTRDTRATGDGYIINGNYIQTTFEEGTVRIHYKAYLTDDSGHPMVPDSRPIFEAIEWYIIRQMIMGGYKHPLFTWRDADTYWHRYRRHAAADSSYPSIDRMEKFKRMWVRMVPSQNQWSDFFMNNQSPENLRR